MEPHIESIIDLAATQYIQVRRLFELLSAEAIDRVHQIEKGQPLSRTTLVVSAWLEGERNRAMDRRLRMAMGRQFTTVCAALSKAMAACVDEVSTLTARTPATCQCTLDDYFRDMEHKEAPDRFSNWTQGNLSESTYGWLTTTPPDRAQA